MVFQFCCKAIDKLSVTPDAIYLGKKFHRSLTSLSESTNDTLYGWIGHTTIRYDAELVGRRVKVEYKGKTRTYNYKTFMQKDNIEF